MTDIARLRANEGIQLAKKHPEMKVYITGSIGRRFGCPRIPHYIALKKYLLSKGLSKSRIIAEHNSKHTLDVARNLRKIIPSTCKILFIISSDYHLPRVRYIFDRIFESTDIQYVSASSPKVGSLWRRIQEIIAGVYLRALMMRIYHSE